MGSKLMNNNIDKREENELQKETQSKSTPVPQIKSKLGPRENDLRQDPETPQKELPEGLRGRLARVKPSRWVRFGIVSILFFLFVIWVGNPWLFLLWFLLVDIYITAFIPWNWWKSKKGATRTVMAWVDAIVYALVLVYIIFAFIGQNYKIPSSSLEKSLLVGDFLWVNKTTYGPRVPNTLLHFPLAQHTMPFFGGKSYFDKPQIGYHRLPGIRSVERGDIVVFNFPEGDTVFSRQPERRYYEEIFMLKAKGVDNPMEYIAKNKEFYGDIIVRPVDRRENYVKRTIGLPGERLRIKNDTIYINGKAIDFPDNVQFNYIIPVKQAIPDDRWLALGVRREDHGVAPLEGLEMNGMKYYTVPLTAEMKKQVEHWPEVAGPLLKENVAGFYFMGNVWPLGNQWDWTRSDTDEFWIPKRGSTIHLTLQNLPLYRRAIETYEGNKVEIKNNKIYINGKENPYYTFKLDYYWMMGDNRDRSLDSRYFGLVPEDHIVGTPERILISIDEERPMLDANKVRWNRIFANPNPDRAKASEKNWK